MAMTTDQLNRAIADLLEPYESLPEPDEWLAVTDEPRPSPKRCWMAIALYDEGDVPRWQPRDFTTDPECTVMLLNELIKLNQVVLFSNGDNIFCSVQTSKYSGISKDGDSLSKAVALAYGRARGIEG